MNILRNNKIFLKTLAFLAIPIVLQELVHSSVNMADTFMVGRLGVNELTSVGLANQIFFLFILIIFGINSGASIFMGQYWGKGEIQNIHKVMGICAVSGFSVAVCFFLATRLCPEFLMGIYSKDPSVIALGADYLRIIGYAYLITALTVSFNASLRSIGMTTIPMLTTFISLIVNILLNYIFIFKLGRGVSGAALATVFARAVEFSVLYMIIRFRKLPVYSKLKGYFTADGPFLKTFYIVTTPVILNEFLWALGTTIYNIAYKFSGTEAQGAFQIASTVQNLFLVISLGIGSASGIMISNKLGAEDIKMAVDYARKSILVTILVGAVMGVLLIFTAPYILALFEISEIVRKYAYYTIIVVGACTIFKTTNFVNIVGILRSGGDTNFCLILDAASVWLIGIPLAFLGSYFLHLPIYYTVLLVYTEEIVKFFISSKRVFSNVWAKSVISPSRKT